MKKYGLTGFPLSHSFSKKYFEDKFQRESINSRFELYPLKDLIHLPSLVRTEPLLQGLAVTIPHKENIITYLDEMDPAAALIGAVNCIRIQNSKMKGYNTDFIGFEKSLLPLLQDFHTHTLVLGSGGSSKAVQFVLQKLKIIFTVISSSGKSNVSYEQIDEKMMQKNTLIINCTPLGMYPAINSKPSIPYQHLTTRHLLYDLVYNPEMTAFLAEGIKYGSIIKNGLEMLHLQAEENWRIWNS